MPIWPVSFVDGSIQVADADGAFYPIMMQGNAVTEFNPGWTARGLQTGLPPFHVLELEHDDGGSTYWLLDSALEYRGNAVVHLREEDRRLYSGHVEPLVRTLYHDAVLASHATIPAAVHEFDGFLDNTVAELIGLPIQSAIGRPDMVSTASLAQLGSSYNRNGISLSTSWIDAVLRAPLFGNGAAPSVPAPADDVPMTVQDTLELPRHAGFRYLEHATGLVFYLLVGEGENDRHLYVPAAGVVFTVGVIEAAHDPLSLLMVHYATHAGDPVVLPDPKTLEPDLAHVATAPQAGLDEPVADPGTDSVGSTSGPGLPKAAMPAAAAGRVMPDDLKPVPEPVQQSSYRPTPPVPVAVAVAAPRRNWWQRLLGLGNG